MSVYKANVYVSEHPNSRTVYVDAKCYSEVEYKLYQNYGNECCIYNISAVEGNVDIISHIPILAEKPTSVRTILRVEGGNYE